jgi:DNA polymerase III sliding clamp (beta) subunit (PCNA family)
MLIRVNVNDLRAAVHVAAVCGKGRTSNEIASRVLISAHNGKCTIEATDHETWMQIAVAGADVEEDGDALPIGKFLDRVLGVHPDDAIAVLQTGGGDKMDPLQLTVSVGRSRVRLHCLPAEEWPTEKPADAFKTEVDLPADELLALIQSVQYATARVRGDKPALEGVNLLFTPIAGEQAIEASATDGFRMARNKAVLPAYLPIEAEATIPGALLRRLTPAITAAGRIRIATDEARIRLTIDDDTVITSPLMIDAYPDFTKVLGKRGGKPTIEVAATFTGARAEILAALDSLAIVTGARTPLAIKAGGKTLKLHAAAEGSSAGLMQIDGEVAVRDAGGLKPVGVPIHQLHDAVKAAGPEVEIVIPVMPGGQTVEINTVGVPGHRQAIALASLNKPLPADRLPPEVDDDGE